MEIETKHVLPYLLHDLHVLHQGLACEVEGIDLHFKNTIIVERRNTNLSEVKLILRPFEDWKSIEEIYDRVPGETEEDFESSEDEFLEIFDGLPEYVKQYFYKHKIDVFSLLPNDLAITKENLPSLESLY